MDLEISQLNALRAFDQAEHGSWPMPGGWLDQTQSVLDAVAFVRAEQNRAEAAATKVISDG